MEKVCEGCGVTYEAKTRRSRFHSDVCRVQANRKQRATVTPLRPDPDSGEPLEGNVTQAVRAELEKAEREDSTAGRQALDLARRIDGCAEASSAVASLHRELRATMEVALALSEQANQVDELRARRMAKAQGA